LFYSPGKAKTSGRIRKWVDKNTKASSQAAKKRAAAAKKGAEGPKKSKPGGYARTPFNQPSSKKKRRV
jgi:hypothetical protein